MSFLGRVVRHLVFGLEDGSVSTLGAITGIAIGTGEASIVLLSGLVIIAVEALSMGAGTYLSAKSTRKTYEQAIKKLHQALHTKPSVERSHLVSYYHKCGLSKTSAEAVVASIASDHKALLLDLTAHEAQISPDAGENELVSAGVMWVSYVIGGAVPMIFYIFMPIGTALPWSVAGTLAFLFVVGFAKARLTGEKPLTAALEMVGVSAGATVIGFVVGRLASQFLGI